MFLIGLLISLLVGYIGFLIFGALDMMFGATGVLIGILILAYGLIWYIIKLSKRLGQTERQIENLRDEQEELRKMLQATQGSDVDLPDDLIFNVGDTTYNLGGDITGTINYADGADAMKKTITVNWEWDYGSDDTAARNDNDYAGKSWTLDIKATGTQVEPTSTTA